MRRHELPVRVDRGTDLGLPVELHGLVLRQLPWPSVRALERLHLVVGEGEPDDERGYGDEHGARRAAAEEAGEQGCGESDGHEQEPRQERVVGRLQYEQDDEHRQRQRERELAHVGLPRPVGADRQHRHGEQEDRAERPEGRPVLVRRPVEAAGGARVLDRDVRDPGKECDQCAAADHERRCEQRHRDARALEKRAAGAGLPVRPDADDRSDDDAGDRERVDEPIREYRDVERPVDDVDRALQGVGEGGRRGERCPAGAVPERVAGVGRVEHVAPHRDRDETGRGAYSTTTAMSGRASRAARPGSARREPS